MNWNLERVLFWLSAIAAVFLALTLLNYVAPFANQNQPIHRVQVGLAVDVSGFLFSVVAYVLIRGKQTKSGLAVVSIWIVASFCYGIAILVFEPLSGFTITIALGQLIICCFLAHYSLLEAKSTGVLRRV